jgi:hypothetical protein
MNIFGAHITVRIAIPALAVGIAIAGVGFVIINQVQRAAVEKQAVKTAESVVAQMLATRAVYTKDVVSKLQTDGVNIEFGPDFREKQRHVPLPATMVHLISDEVNKQGLYTIDLISPWAINPAKQPAAGWERNSTDALIIDSKSPKSEIDTSGGKSKLLYMAADFASTPACVQCHNNLPDSPKKDYELGDMMGSLVVTIPLTEEFSSARNQSVYIALGNIGVIAVLAVLLVFLWRRIA